VSGLRGIAKNLSALFSSHAINLVQQVALVPLFIHSYGKAGYGEWLAISAAVSYLGTLDFGVQTFVNQDLTVRYHRRDMADFHVNQSTALRLLLGIVLLAAVCSTVVFALPMQHLLKMDGVHGDPVVAPRVVQMAIFFMALVALTHVVFGYFAGTFMVLGKAYVGANWNNARTMSGIGTTLVAVLCHASFAQIGIAQLAGLWVCLVAQMWHLRRMGPDIFPTLKYWDSALVPKILKPSGYFALIFSSNFLVYQVPILILQTAAGGAAVTVFSLMRTIFSMTRNMLNVLTQSMGPEVTSLFAKGDWAGLSRLYNYSERLIFSVIPAANVGVLYLSPFLLTIWLKQPGLFDPRLYLVSAASSIVMATKEHKFQFQFSTNTHQELARFMFGTYVLLGGLWLVFIPRFGVIGLVWCWFGVELAQLVYLIHLNAGFFAHFEVLDKKYLWRLAGLSVSFLAGAWVALPYTKGMGLPVQVGIAVVNGAALLGLAVPLFGLDAVWGEFRARRRGVVGA
jgi:O-antigen/teichoic acid export membrane protein